MYTGQQPPANTATGRASPKRQSMNAERGSPNRQLVTMGRSSPKRQIDEPKKNNFQIDFYNKSTTGQTEVYVDDNSGQQSSMLSENADPTTAYEDIYSRLKQYSVTQRSKALEDLIRHLIDQPIEVINGEI